MYFKLKLVIETHTNSNIFIVVENGKIPAEEINQDPKLLCSYLLEKITGYKVNPYEVSWINFELSDTDFRDETVYIVYVCRIPEKMSLKSPYSWTEYSKIKEELEGVQKVF